MKLMIIFASTRQGRQGEIVANWVRHGAENDSRFELDWVDLRDVKLPFFDEPVDPFGMKDAGVDYTNPEGKAWAESVGKAEAIIIVTPEYNHGYPAVLKNALDWVGPEWVDKPVGFISYGLTAGGARSVEQLRQVVATLGLIQLPRAIHFPSFKKAFDEKGEPVRQSANATLKYMFDETVRFAEAFKK